MITWISRRGSYFVGILSGVRDIFLLGCPQVFSMFNLRFRVISEPHKSPILLIKKNIKVQFKEENPLIDSIDYARVGLELIWDIEVSTTLSMK